MEAFLDQSLNGVDGVIFAGDARDFSVRNLLLVLWIVSAPAVGVSGAPRLTSGTWKKKLAYVVTWSQQALTLLLLLVLRTSLFPLLTLLLLLLLLLAAAAAALLWGRSSALARIDLAQVVDGEDGVVLTRFPGNIAPGR